MAKINVRAILVLILIVLIIGFLIFISINSNKQRGIKNREIFSKTFAEDYLVDHCNCLERERFACGFEGFVFREGFCWNGSVATNPIRRCSKYQCSGGDILNFNGTDWEIAETN